MSEDTRYALISCVVIAVGVFHLGLIAISRGGLA